MCLRTEIKNKKIQIYGIIIIYYDVGVSIMEEILKRREIDYLFHFTRGENLGSIFINGLVPREDINKDNLVGIVNDGYRYDKCEDANCMSVEFPNYKMFYTLRCNNPTTEWAVLALDAQLIKDFECAFCYANAGSGEIYTTPLKQRTGRKAFEDIFSERDIYPTRETLDIPKCYPTNPQAEVLVFGTIPISYIKYAIFENNAILNKYKPLIPSSVECIVNSDYFFGRSDYEHWR